MALRSIERALSRLRIVGAVAGMALAVTASVELAPRPARVLPPSAAALVNGKVIGRRSVDAALSAMAGAASNGVPVDRNQVIEGLIDEELLVQRGVEIGLQDSDRAVRKAIAMAMIDALVVPAGRLPLDERRLRKFFDANPAEYSEPPRLRVKRMFFRDSSKGDSLSRAENAAAALARGGDFDQVRIAYADASSVSLPGDMMPPQVLRRYLGASLADSVLDLEAGQVSRPLPSAGGTNLVLIVESRPRRLRPYDEVREEVKAGYLKQFRDLALREGLERLWHEADVVVFGEDSR